MCLPYLFFLYRTDLPRYFIYSKGRIVEDILDLGGFDSMWTEYVSFYLGCSFTFETALMENGVKLPHVLRGKNVSIYDSNIALCPVGPFKGKMVITMRMVAKNLLGKAFMISSQYPDHHSAPVHIGDPSRIGVNDIMKPEKGDPPIEVQDGDVPMFWACGVTMQEAIFSASMLNTPLSAMTHVYNIYFTVEPRLAFSHYPGSMFITDVKVEPKDLEDTVEIVQLSRPNDAYFASVINHKSLPFFEVLERALLDDPGKRGIAHLFQKSDLLKATLALSHARTVAVTTGFPACTEFDVKEETDGLPGALAVCQALITLGKEVTLIVDEGSEKLYNSCVEHLVGTGAFEAGKLTVIPFEKAKERLQQSSSPSPPVYNCLLAIERAGRNCRGTYCSMKGKDISQYVQPVDELFEMARQNPHVTTIGIGDGGNELGMGKVYDSVVKNIPLGETIACNVSADYLVVSGVSNWGGYAVAGGLYVASSSPFHWRYRNHAINADQPPQFNLHKFLPTTEQVSYNIIFSAKVDRCE